MAYLDRLKAELTDDPLGRGYAGMTAEGVAADLNTVYRTLNINSISGDEAFQATDSTEFATRTDHQQQLWMALCSRASIDPFGAANVALVQSIFGGGSATISNLSSIRTKPGSRAEELELGEVTASQVQNVRDHS